MDVDGKLEGIAHVHVRILGIEIILLTSLKIQQGLKLRVCFSKVDKSWVGDFNWALPLWQFNPFFTTIIVLSKVFCLSNLSQSVLLPVDICDQSQDNNGFQTRRFRRFYEC